MSRLIIASASTKGSEKARTSMRAQSYMLRGVSERNFRNTMSNACSILIDFSLTVKAATLKFISTTSSAEQGKSGSIYNLVKNE